MQSRPHSTAARGVCALANGLGDRKSDRLRDDNLSFKPTERPQVGAVARITLCCRIVSLDGLSCKNGLHVTGINLSVKLVQSKAVTQPVHSNYGDARDALQ